MFHSLRKLTDVIEIIVNFNVIRVDIPADTLFRLIVSLNYSRHRLVIALTQGKH